MQVDELLAGQGARISRGMVEDMILQGGSTREEAMRPYWVWCFPNGSLCKPSGILSPPFLWHHSSTYTLHFTSNDPEMIIPGLNE